MSHRTVRPAALMGAAAMALASPASAERALVVAANQEVQSLQAQLTYKEVNAVGLRNVIEQLVGLDPETGELFGMLATDWEQVEPTRWRFQLREGVTFHDGSPFDAEAAAVSLDWVWREDNAFTIRELAGPALTFKAVDERTLDVVSAEPDPLIPQRMYLAGIGSARQIEEDPLAHDNAPIGTGPYVFEEWRPGQFWTASLNGDWWGNDAEDSYGTQHFDRVTILFRPETEVRASMVETGEATIAMFISDEQCARFEADPDLQCFSEASDTYLFARLDHTGAYPALSDERVREAFELAIDMEGIVTQIVGLATPATGQMLPSVAVGYDEELDDPGYDPDRAAELLAEVREEGVEVPPLHVAARVGSTPRNDQVIEAIGFMLDQAGFQTTVALEEPAVFNEWVTTKPGEDRSNVMVHVMNNPLMDFAITLTANYSCGSVVSVHCDPDFDARLAEAAQLVGEERAEALRALVREVHDERVVYPLGMVARAYGAPAGLEWTFGLDHRIVAVNMAMEE